MPGNSEGEPAAFVEPSYRATFESLQDRLIVAEEIPDDLDVSFVRSRRGVRPSSFTIREIDRTQLGLVMAPGKSGHIKFTDSRRAFCSAVMGTTPEDWYKLLHVPVTELKTAGFVTLYAPLKNAPLHVRVIHEAHILDPQLPDIPLDAKRALVAIFNPKIRTR